MSSPGTERRDFFISFNSADRPWAEWIASELEWAGYTTFFQHWDFHPGSNFVLEMQKAAAQSDRTIAVFSPAYFRALFTQPEWAAALVQDPTGAERKLIPFQVQACEPEGLLKALVYCDLVGLDEEAARQALLSAVSPVRPAAGSVPFPTAKAKKRFPGTLPARWNLLGARNPHYLDRDNLLARLAEALRKGHAAALTQTLAGLGGVGKSTLAREYAHQYAAEYDTVWWIRAESDATLLPDLAALAHAAQVAGPEVRDIDAAPAAVRWLRGQVRWLLVFDNAVSPEPLQPWLPGGTAGHVLITSRSPHWRGWGETLPLAAFTPEQGAEFLAARAGIATEPEAARALAQELGGLPLALEIAASYMEEKSKTISEYRALLARHSARLLEPVAQAFQLSIDQLSSASLRLLQQLSYLAPDDVPRQLLMEDELAFDEALAGLTRYSLVEVKGSGIFTHRLVQSAVRGGEGVLAEVVERLNVAFRYQSDDLATWAESGRLFPHVVALGGHTATSGMESAALARLLNAAGGYALYVLADLAVALGLLRRALAIAEKVYGPEHPEVAIRANNIGQILKAHGDLAGALAYTQRALAIAEKAHGSEHPHVATYANNIGQILKAQGDLAGALACTQRALAIAEKVYGSEHPHVATCANNIGQILQDQGALAGALAYTQRALAIAEKVYGSEHPEVAIRANNIGAILQAQGDLAGALAYTQRALAIAEKVYGPEHPEVATYANNIGQILQAQGDLAGALAYTQRALAIDEKVYGLVHPEVATDANNIGQILQAQGDLAGALAYTQRALAIGEKVYGPEHPAVAIRTNNIGQILQDQGDLAGALAYAQRSLAIFQKVLGAEHPNTRAVAENLAAIEAELRAQGDQSPPTD